MVKVYGIICDESGRDILVGTGGTSGDNCAPRQGYHLPGGKPVGSEGPMQAFARELGEEFGDKAEGVLASVDIEPEPAFKSGEGWSERHFLVAVMRMPLTRWAGPVSGGCVRRYDSAFERVEVRSVQDVIDDGDGTPDRGWFADGLKEFLRRR